MTDTATPRPAPWSRRTIIVGGGAGVVLLVLGVWLIFAKLPGWLASSDEGERGAPTEPGAVGEARKIQALLFYVTDDGAELQSATHEVLYGATPAEQARHIIEAQIHAATADRVTAIPDGTKVRAVYVGAKGDAYVDLSPEVRSAHSGGSLNEALTVFTIVNVLTSNLPGITSVQILIDGQEVDSLAGHVDLRHPLTRADAWVRKGQ